VFCVVLLLWVLNDKTGVFWGIEPSSVCGARPVGVRWCNGGLWLCVWLGLVALVSKFWWLTG
jgi:hypothetical protein